MKAQHIRSTMLANAAEVSPRAGTRGQGRKASARIDPLGSAATAVLGDNEAGHSDFAPHRELNGAIRVLVVDDHPMVRHALCKALGEEGDIDVVGQAGDGRQALELAQELKPDVTVMDVSMPSLNGIEATRLIHSELPQTRVIGLSMLGTRRYFSEMFRAGASGYLLKNCKFDELVMAIRCVASGQSYLSAKLSDEIIEGYAQMTPDRIADPYATLTGREREILQLMTEGSSVKQIGQALRISPKTVESHRVRIMDKLKLSSIAELTKYAIREGLTPSDA